MGILIVLGILGLVREILVEGYLADPFLHAKSDSFNDWYNPAYWANNLGAYSEWKSIYPPFSFIFIKLFSNERCYHYAVTSARECDPAGIVLISVLTILNFLLVWRVFRGIDRATALPRALAAGLGLPVIFAWERGNLIVPCYTAFILAYGNLLKSARLKTLCAAISLSFKPYLILALTGHFLKRDWVRLEWCGLFFIALYAGSLAILEAGDPMTLVGNTAVFDHTPGIDLITFTTTYTGLLTILQLPLPIIQIIGSAPVDALERYIPPMIYVGAAGVMACLAYATARRGVLSKARSSALALVLFMSVSVAPGGYAVQFALFFVFFEPLKGVGRVLALLGAYLWCIPFDLTAATIYHDLGFSFLGQRIVSYDLNFTYGQLLRPGLLLLIEYGLVYASVGAIVRDLRLLREQRIGRTVQAVTDYAPRGAIPRA